MSYVLPHAGQEAREGVRRRSLGVRRTNPPVVCNTSLPRSLAHNTSSPRSLQHPSYLRRSSHLRPTHWWTPHASPDVLSQSSKGRVPRGAGS
jgi:hypothetical protein